MPSGVVCGWVGLNQIENKIGGKGRLENMSVGFIEIIKPDLRFCAADPCLHVSLDNACLHIVKRTGFRFVSAFRSGFVSGFVSGFGFWFGCDCQNLFPYPSTPYTIFSYFYIFF